MRKIVLVIACIVFVTSLQASLAPFTVPCLIAKGSYNTAKSVYNKITELTTLEELQFERNKGLFYAPGDEEEKTSYFSAPTPKESQREDWYKYSQYIAEPLCTVTNLGFLYVGTQYNCPELTFAGMASIVSHSIPKNWLLHVDKLGVAVVGTRALRELPVLLTIAQQHPIFAVGLVTAAPIVQVFDAYLARKKGKSWFHAVPWHVGMALLVGAYLSYKTSHGLDGMEYSWSDFFNMARRS